jgi:hypothetical protein
MLSQNFWDFTGAALALSRISLMPAGNNVHKLFAQWASSLLTLTIIGILVSHLLMVYNLKYLFGYTSFWYKMITTPSNKLRKKIFETFGIGWVSRIHRIRSASQLKLRQSHDSLRRNENLVWFDRICNWLKLYCIKTTMVATIQLF